MATFVRIGNVLLRELATNSAVLLGMPSEGTGADRDRVAFDQKSSHMLPS